MSILFNTPIVYLRAATAGLSQLHAVKRTLPLAFAQGSSRAFSNASNEHFDLVILGAGIAGLSAALQASISKPSTKILLLDRYAGGGAASLSGGVVYAGGGTKQQVAAGYKDDSPQNLFEYLKRETGLSNPEEKPVVDEDTLRRFCEESPGMIEWLEKFGCNFDGKVCEYRTSYPKEEYTLYYSGNEKAYPYTLTSNPAPRGHRPAGSGLTGRNITANLFKAVLAEPNVTFRPYSQVDSLSLSPASQIPEIQYRHLPKSSRPRLHEFYEKMVKKTLIFLPDLAMSFSRRSQKIFDRLSQRCTVSSNAVILAMGGFIHNPNFLGKRYGAPYHNAGIFPLGTPGDDGAGISLGLSIGGKAERLDRFTAWRFFYPPEAFLSGISIGSNGKRIGNEGLYGAMWAERLIHEHGGIGWLVMDEQVWKEAWAQKDVQCEKFTRFGVEMQMRWGHWKAETLEELGKKIGVKDVAEMAKTVREYNDTVKEGGIGDVMKKQVQYCHPLTKAPFYAINLSLPKTAQNKYSLPFSGLSLGGLVVDGKTGRLVSKDTGKPVEGVFAAGRTAVGICSRSYVSGLSLADGIFSGRRAGRAAVTGQ